MSAKYNIYTRFPFRMGVRREIPGVTQVDEKGHEGNTAVVTAYIYWTKNGIYLS